MIKNRTLGNVLLMLCAGVYIGGTMLLPAHASPGGKTRVVIDGSSTVFPITEAVAEEFRSVRRDVSVTVGVSGTGGGFKKFVAGEVDIVDASRPIKPSEIAKALENNISFIEIPVAYDALSVVVNKDNTWVKNLSIGELKKIWEPEAQGRVKMWSDVRAGFPDTPISLFGPGTDSGTFDYFTEVINGKEDASRGDYTSSEDDNVIVTGVAGDKGGLGYFGLAFYEANNARLRVVSIDDGDPSNGNGPQEPTTENVESGAYAPLSRPLFIYVKSESLKRPEVAEFVSFYLDNVRELSAEVGYVPLSPTISALVQQRLQRKTVGSLFTNKVAKEKQSLEALLR